MSVRVVVYTRPGCHLCEDACEAVARVTADVGVGWRAHDITGDEDLTRRWGEYVPVVLVDGDVLDWFRVDEQRLRTALR